MLTDATDATLPYDFISKGRCAHAQELYEGGDRLNGRALSPERYEYSTVPWEAEASMQAG